MRSQAKMTKVLAAWLLCISGVLLSYWFMSILQMLGVFERPASMMFADFNNLRVVAWNWSFFPVAMLISVTGLMAFYMSHRNDMRWRSVAIVSLSSTICAGTMACCYWAILGEFDPSWFLPNLALAIVPLFPLRGLVRI